jgi:hypothetical protein
MSEYPKDHIYCGCPECGECFCSKCKEPIEKRKPMSKWTKCSHQLPPLRQTVLVFECYGKGKIIQRMRTKECSVHWEPCREDNIHTGRYTHWMPLPEAPHE